MDLRREKMQNELATTAKPLKHDAFWHLQAIGLLAPTDPKNPKTQAEPREETGTWKALEAAPGALVAIIDNGVSMHPYLEGRLKEPYFSAAVKDVVSLGVRSADNKHLNIDLTASPSPIPDKAAAAMAHDDLISVEWLEKLGLYSADTDIPYQIALHKMVQENKGRIPFDNGAPATSNRQFSAHGTACAGIVAASSDYDPNKTENRPYYRGVDPRSRIMSITTSFSPRPDLLLLAFLLAATKEANADVILIPRGLPREILYTEQDFRDQGRPDEAPKWEALRETIIKVSRQIPVVCAAGNESEDKPIAPARFAAIDNGIIGVAAMNYHGNRSSYSNFGAGITVAAPSDDAEIFNKYQARLDKNDRFYVDYPYEYFIANSDPKIEDVPFGEATILAIDIPGAYGFSDAPTDAKANLSTEPESYFTDFGGTSAASSIVAGVAALVQRAAKLKNPGTRLDGIELKKLLQKSARASDFPHLKLAGRNAVPVGVDKVDDDKALSFEESFGAGLVAADLAVNLVLSGSMETPIS
jgi:subtilisin family serine protease